MSKENIKYLENPEELEKEINKLGKKWQETEKESKSLPRIKCYSHHDIIYYQSQEDKGTYAPKKIFSVKCL